MQCTERGRTGEKGIRRERGGGGDGRGVEWRGDDGSSNDVMQGKASLLEGNNREEQKNAAAASTKGRSSRGTKAAPN